MELLAIPLLLAIGGMLALQAAANVQLSTATGSPFGASTLQLGIAAALLLAAAAAAGTLGAFELAANTEPWHLVGGLGSAVYITAGILLFPRLGAVVSVGLFIAGQMLASLTLDGFGWLGVSTETLTAPALLGAAAVVVGAAMIVRAQTGARAAEGAITEEAAEGAVREGAAEGAVREGAPEAAVPRVAAEGAIRRRAVDAAIRGRAAWLALALLAGAVLPVQGAVNAQLRADIDAPATVGALSFLVATVAMALVLVGSLALAGASPPRAAPLHRVPWWGWLGGLCGATYVTAVFLLIPEIGTAATIALTVAGQQVASVFVDRYGLFRLPRRPLSAVRLTGVATLLVGVALIQIP
jgi:bacterial/archaeal transporter family-2 protein